MPVFNCTKCATPLQLPDQLAGKTFACPRCGNQLTIPSTSMPESYAPPPVPSPAPPRGAYQGGPPAHAAAFRDYEAPRRPRDDHDDRPRRDRDEEVGTLAATSSSSSWSKPLLFGLMGALGCFAAALLVCGPHLLLIPGQAKAGGTTAGTAKADVMIVLDVSGSMQFAIDGVERGIKGFVDEFKKSNLDVRVGLTVYRDERFRVPNDRDAGINGDPWTFTFKGGEAYTADVDEFKNIIGRVRADAGGDIPENSLEALQQASRHPTRKDAIKVLILITDATYQPTSTPEATKKTMIDNKVRQLHLIVGEPGGFGNLKNIYERLWDLSPHPSIKDAKVLSGQYYDLNRVAGGEGFTRVLDEFKTSIVVEAQRGIGSTTGVGEFERSQAWRLWIATSLLFAFLAFGLALALIMGQRLYMRQSLLDGSSILKALATFGAGLVGGFLVELLYTQFEMPIVVAIILRTFAWTLVGAIIGLSMALFVPNLKWYKGLLGGVIGGFAGGLLFNLIALLTGAVGGPILGTLLGDWIGAIVLGFCVGIMVALAEVAFRRWWLEVRYGARETRTVTLGTAPVTVGSDERRATVVVRDVPSLVMRYRLDQERVLCEDLESGRRTELEPGDSRKIGNVTITVCSPETVVKLGLFLELSSGQKLPLSDGLPLTADDLPGLSSNSPDGTVALVGKKPADPSVLLLRNRSKQSWTVYDHNGGSRTVEPGLGVPLEAGIEINFGRVQGRLVQSGRSNRRR